MAAGNGAYIVHSVLQESIPGYCLEPIPVKKTLYPLLLRRYRKKARIIHTVPEYSDILFSPNSKSVITFHNYFWDKTYQQYCSTAQSLFYKLLQSGYVKRSIESADKIIAVSKFTAKVITEEFPGVDVYVIPNGVNTEKFSTEHREEKEHINILFSGNPTRRKGLLMLLKIAQGLPQNASLQVTGGLRKLDKEFNHPQIQLMGNIPYKDMPGLYQQADMLLLPSYREGLSLSSLEAMSCSLPVIAYNTSSMSELIIQGKGGYLCPVDSMAELNESINSLCNDRAVMREMGRFNRQRCQKYFKEEGMISKYNDLFNGI